MFQGNVLSCFIYLAENVRMVCLPRAEYFDGKDFDGFSAFIAGWGAVEFREYGQK